ncbi:MAG TPA: hypothetical protein VNP95_10790, partial [Thermomicrobiales bacterium]|nr:hypothetical protein [Thermomicrobiales bacterium]
SDGTMVVQAPEGTVQVTLVYAVTAWDWGARIAAGMGVIAAVGLATGLWARAWRRLGPMRTA